MLEGKKILIGISGSIAAYKSILLVRQLVKVGAEVKVVMTTAAKDFVSPLVLSTLSKHEVLTDLTNNNDWANHVMLGRWADLMIVAPASCNTIAKMANGLCDNLLLAVYLSATCPILIAPAMDEDMWHHASTKRNIELLKGYGHTIMPVGNGELASGLIGEGRMAEPEDIVSFMTEVFFRGIALKNRKILITAGPTYEPIDPVRFIGNHSSGKMGFAIAEAAYLQGADVLLVTGPTHEKIRFSGIQIKQVNNSDEMYDTCLDVFKMMDIGIMSAAVADYKPLVVATDKIKKKDETLSLPLTKTKDILASLGKIKTNHQLLVGFALETKDAQSYALGKLSSKNADAIVLNSLEDANAGFGYSTNKISIFGKDNSQIEFPLKTKYDVAKDIVQYIINHSA